MNSRKPVYPFAEIVNGYVRSLHWYTALPEIDESIAKLVPVPQKDLPLPVGSRYIAETGLFERVIETNRQHLNEIRASRNSRINDVRWAIERHRDQVDLGVRTSLSKKQYLLVLQYVNDLRNITETIDLDAEFLGIAALPWPELDVNVINKVLHRPSGYFGSGKYEPPAYSGTGGAAK
jgi:hypothetical protein